MTGDMIADLSGLSVNAGWRTFRLVVTDDVFTTELKDRLGLTDFDRGIIYVNYVQDRHGMCETLYHEILHVVLDNVGYSIEDDPIKATNEQVVMYTSRGLVTMMRLNKQLFTIINHYLHKENNYEHVPIIRGTKSGDVPGTGDGSNDDRQSKS